MAQRKTPSVPTKRTSSAIKKSAPATKKPGSGTRPPSANRPTGTNRPTGRPPAKKPGKSIVNQKQTPWGLIATTVVIVVFAAAIVIYAVTTHKASDDDKKSTSLGGQAVLTSDPYRQPELAAAKKIKGLTYTVEAEHTHVQGHITYDSTPPVGGNHSQYWADCSGTVYSKAIANENAVHMLEHGAIWITYNAKTLPASQLATLKKLVDGVDRMALSPYPNLKTPLSLQAWGYQLFVNKASDPRVQQFITLLRHNSKTTPEPSAVCTQPTFKSHPSTFGHPLWTPAT